MLLISLALGILSGYFILPEGIVGNLDKIASFALNLLILSVGIDLGFNKKAFENIKEKGLKILLIPLSILTGTLLGGFLCGLIYKMPLNLSLSIASGLGWYSLSGVILAKICSPEAGAIAFLSNVVRELIAIITIPVLAKKLSFITSIAPAGAASMDSTLPLIAEETDDDTVIISFINGAILSALVPILVPLFYNIK
jgi:uncharacterized membrane protein YbjE (DUF340 family)